MFDLSPKELDVLKLIAKGCSNQAIADSMFTQKRTVEHHIHAVLDKLGVRNNPKIHPRVAVTLIYYRGKIVIEGPEEELRKAHEQVMADVLG